MGQKNKGGMWCDHCQRPVLAVKNTHRLRNAVSVGGVVVTGGVSLVGTRVQGYRCPSCGGHVRRKWTSGRKGARRVPDDHRCMMCGKPTSGLYCSGKCRGEAKLWKARVAAEAKAKREGTST